MLLALGRRIEYPEEHKMERDRLVAVVLALCVFGFHSLRSQSLSEPSANFRTIPQVYDPSRAVHTIPQVYGRSQRFTDVRTIPRLGGCWKGTIRAQDMTEQIVVGSFQLGSWIDEEYRICFGNDMRPQVSVAVTKLEMRSSRSDIVRIDASRVIFTNYLILADHDQGTSSHNAFEIEQTTEFQGRADNGCLIVKATAVGKRDWTFAYRIAWQAIFYRD
jgi:hypothetical protein